LELTGDARALALGHDRPVEPERERLAEAVDRNREASVDEVLARATATDAAATGEDETARLVRRARGGDADAREALIERLLPLVAALARRYRTEGLDQADLLQEGVVGVLRALGRNDAAAGVPFSAFASWWIRNALQELRSDFVRPFRLPPRALRQLSQLKSEHQRMYREEHRSAGVGELAERTHIALDQANALVAADARVRSLDEAVEGAEGEVGTLGDLLEDPLSADAYEDVIDAVAGEQLRTLLSRLTERERDIVRARFGFDGHAENLAAVGERLGVSAERVRQLEERALAKLRHAA
jgi:RNA polymerase sigma factor (sigma-70 family)